MAGSPLLDSGKYQTGDVVPYHFTWWIILLSYFVSLIGAETTVEALHRRRAGRDLISQLHLGVCAICFGLVAIWCMHFVGNRAITLGDGRAGLQLYYNPGFTVLSALLPIVFLYLGFFITDRFSKSARSMYMSLVATGLAAGLSIVGMHYIGNLGTANYDLSNDYRHILGSAAIAVGACWFSFTIFFRQRELWINAWYWRLLCAIILASAVSGMHWTASAGTTYRLRTTELTSTRNRNENVIVATVLCMVALLGCVVLQLWTNRRRRQLADRAQHVVLAAFMVDKEGRVLVTAEGLLPTQKITRQYNQRSFNDEFNTSHPVFQWIYRVTHNWDGIAELVPTMRAHLRAAGIIRTPSRPATGGYTRSPYDDSAADGDYSAVFREQFCVAAQDLAEALKLPLQRLGKLYDDIMMTGVHSSKCKTASEQDLTADIEAGRVIPALFGKGQVLFVANRLEDDEVYRLTEMGFRLAPVNRLDDKVLDLMSRAMQVRRETLLTTSRRLRGVCSPDKAVLEAPLSTPGAYLTCFVLRPAMRSSLSGWDVLVDKQQPDHVPNTFLTSAKLNLDQMRALQDMDSQTWTWCVTHCDKMRNEAADKDLRDFYSLLSGALTRMAPLVPAQFLRNALFCGTPVANHPRLQKTPALLYSFCAIPDVHNSSLSSTDLVTWLPLSFLRCRQRVYKDSPDHAILAQRNHVEFSALLSSLKGCSAESTAPNSGIISRRLSISKPGSRRLSISKAIDPTTPNRPRAGFLAKFSRKNSDIPASDVSDGSSEKGLVRPSSAGAEGHGGTGLGGIMVSQEIMVDTEGGQEEDDKGGVGIEMRDLGFRTEAGVQGVERGTWADELLRVTSERWTKV